MTAWCCAPTCFVRSAARHPVILSYGPYAKGLSFQEGYKSNWARLTKAAPEVLKGSSNRYQNWELVDPEKWVPDGYICVRVDSRGAGRSPGYLDIWSPRETQDLYQCIEWAGTQPWSNGKVGINGISYYAHEPVAGRRAASRRISPRCASGRVRPTITASCAATAASCRDFLASWYPRQVASVQHGVGDARREERGHRRARRRPGDTARRGAGAEPRAISRRGETRRRLIDDYYRARMPEFEKIDVPLLSAANWGGMGLHPRGNFEGCCAPAPEQKWLEVHGDTHFTHFYSELRRGAAEAILRPLPQRRGHRLGAAAARVAQHPPSRREVRAARRERMAARAHALDEILSCSRTDVGSAPRCLRQRRSSTYDTTGDGLTFLHAAAEREPRDHRAGGGEAVRVVADTLTPTCSWFCACSIRPARKSPSSARTTRACRSGSAGCVHRIASSIRSGRCRTGRGTRMTRNGRSRPACRSNSMSKSGRPRSSCRPATGSALTVRGKDYEVDGTDAAGPCALSDEGRRAVPARRSGRPPGGDLRVREQPALRRRQDALSLVAGDPAGVVLPRPNREERSMRHVRLAAAVLALLAFAAPCLAQQYPSRIVTIIVPYPAGGPTDQLARAAGAGTSEKLGQNFIVENVSGGGTNIATGAGRARRARRPHAAAAQSADLGQLSRCMQPAVRHREGPHADHLHQQQPAGADRPQDARAQHARRAHRLDEDAAGQDGASRHRRHRPSRHLAVRAGGQGRRSITFLTAARRRRCRTSPAATSICSSPRRSRWCSRSRPDR